MEKSFRLIRSPRRRNLAFGIDPENGELLVYAPLRMSKGAIEQLISMHPDVIGTLRRRVLEKAAARPEYRFGEGGEFWYLGKKYPLRFSGRLRYFDQAFFVPRGTEEEIREQLTTLYAKLAQEYLLDNVTRRATEFSLSVRQIRITGARTRWGSCTARGTLSFCWRLVLWPPDFIDYVVCHELAHRVKLNHSPRFWEVLGKMRPDCREKRAYMRDHYMEYEAW